MSLLQAYKAWIKRNGEEPRLPALNYTNDQLFFISAAQVVSLLLICVTHLGDNKINLIETLTDFYILKQKEKNLLVQAAAKGTDIAMAVDMFVSINFLVFPMMFSSLRSSFIGLLTGIKVPL